jgi:hypothetical protein
MGKYLKKFNTKEEYEAFKASSEYLTPNVSFIETAGSVINDSYQIECDCEGGDMKYYLKPENLDDTRKKFMVQASQLVKCDVGEGGIVILSPMAMFGLGEAMWEAILAIAVNPSTRLCFPTISGTVEELFGSQVEGYTEITEEEFYNLDVTI